MQLTETILLYFIGPASGDNASSQDIILPSEVLWKLFVTGLIAGGANLSIVEVPEMKLFLEHVVGPVPTPETLYNCVAFPIEQKFLEDVCFLHNCY